MEQTQQLEFWEHWEFQPQPQNNTNIHELTGKTSSEIIEIISNSDQIELFIQ